MPQRLLLMQWNGTSWRPIHLASALRREYSIQGLACSSRRFCVAVGSTGPDKLGGVHQAPFVAEWNGTRWTEQHPSVFTEDGTKYLNATDQGLTGVICRPSGFCAISGYVGGSNPGSTGGYYGRNPVYPLIAVAQGGHWVQRQIASLAETGDTQAVAQGISCPSTHDCVLAGFYGNTDHSLIETWNGSSVSFVPTPVDPTKFRATLAGIACPTLKVCFAAGSYWQTNSQGEGIIEEGPAGIGQ